MKKMFFATALLVAAIASNNNASAQELNVRMVRIDGQEGYFVPSDKVSATTASYLNEALTDLPYYQAIDVERRTTRGDVVTVEKLGGKGAEAFGHGIEIFAGVNVCENSVTEGAFFSPEFGIRYRHDWRWVSVSIGGSAMMRQYNAEAIDPGTTYLAYASDARFHVNVLCMGQYEHVINLYAQGGYLFGKHRKDVQVNQEGQCVPLAHNGSGLTFGGGIEYRWQMHATGNALTLNLGYKHFPSTYVGNTHKAGSLYLQVGFNFGVKRHRVNNLR